MPYLKAEDKKRLNVHGYEPKDPKTPGELNYWLTSVCQMYLQTTDHKYTDYNTVVGALECAKLEFYRRAVSVYENQKIKENGDVY